jgi:hypothetical protein
VAYTSVGPSTIRGQRSPGLARILRELLAKIELQKHADCPTSGFSELLNKDTKAIQKKMTESARHWGIARKVINIFLRSATYNSFLRDEFQLDRLEEYLEIPLDSLTVKGLKIRSPRGSLPRWGGVKHLADSDSLSFQLRASEIAEELGSHRVHLDIFLWVDRPSKSSDF